MKRRQQYGRLPVQARNQQGEARMMPSTIVRNVNSALMVVALVAGAVLPVHDVMAQQSAASSRQAYQIAAGALGEALADFGSRAGVTVQFSSALVDGRRTTGLNGNFSVQEGFARLLSGTGLEVVEHSQGTYILRATTEATLPVVTVAAGTGEQGSEGTYTVPVVSTFKGQKLKEIPHSVSVVTRQQIEDQGLTTLTETLDRTTGVSVNRRGTLSGITHGNDSNFSSRGFTVSNMQIDGGASMDTDMSGFGSISQLDMAQFDRLEFVRGVDGLFSSTGEPGGTVNLVRKRPLSERQTTLSLATGSWNNHRIDIDTGGPLTESGNIRGRAGLAYEDREYFYDIANTRKAVFYGSVEVDVTPDTLLTVGGSYQTSNGTLSVGGLPRYTNGDDLGLSRNTALTADWSKSEEKTKQVFTKLEHRLNSDWTVSADAMYLDITRDANIVYALGAIDPIDKTGAMWHSYPADSGMKRWALNAYLKGSFDALGRTHDLIVGADYSRARSIGMQRISSIGGTPLDVFNPVQPEEVGSRFLKDDHRTSERTALYSSLRLALADKLKFMVGGRYSSYAFETHNKQYNADGSVALDQALGTVRTNGVLTPYAGVVYAFNDNWNAYASYAETYNPQDVSLRGPLPGSRMDPMQSKNYEVGIKGELIPGKLNASIALYQIDRTGEAVEDPDYAMKYGLATCCYLNKGKVVSRGVDLELSGEIARGWQVVAGYTFNTNKDEDAELERYSSKTPKHLAKLWTTYNLPGSLSQWRVGGGVTVQSANYVDGWATTYNPISGKWDGDDVPFKFTQGGYALWNARVDYEINKQWSVAVNVNNLFDKTYYQTVGYNYFGNFYGEPRNFGITLRGKF
jgi:outer membrane receptor for ferric coprogen and ferric-rhodotorulic acid